MYSTKKDVNCMTIPKFTMAMRLGPQVQQQDGGLMGLSHVDKIVEVYEGAQCRRGQRDHKDGSRSNAPPNLDQAAY